MKNYLIVLGSLSLTVGVVHANDSDILSRTRSRYEAINRQAPKLRTQTRDLSGYSLEGGALMAYLDNGVPRKLVARHYGESGRTTDELYFWKGRLFFVLSAAVRYEKPLGQAGAPGKFLPSGQERFYFSNGRLWRYVDAQGRIVTSKESLQKHETEPLKFAREMLRGLRSSNRTITASR